MNFENVAEREGFEVAHSRRIVVLGGERGIRSCPLASRVVSYRLRYSALLTRALAPSQQENDTLCHFLVVHPERTVPLYRFEFPTRSHTKRDSTP